MYVGDATKATAEKGEAMFADMVKGFVKAIRVVKGDAVTRGLLEEVLGGREDPHPPFWRCIPIGKDADSI